MEICAGNLEILAVFRTSEFKKPISVFCFLPIYDNSRLANVNNSVFASFEN